MIFSKVYGSLLVGRRKMTRVKFFLMCLLIMCNMHLKLAVSQNTTKLNDTQEDVEGYQSFNINVAFKQYEHDNEVRMS